MKKSTCLLGIFFNVYELKKRSFMGLQPVLRIRIQIGSDPGIGFRIRSLVF
jgi:hypothetical protein